MSQIIKYHYPYWVWEDFKNGMYNTTLDLDTNETIDNCINLLKDAKVFYDCGIELLNKWPISVNQNLSNKSINRRSWLGAACCCYLYDAPEYVTRLAWKQLTELQQSQANEIANKIINEYERKNKSLHW